MLLSKTAGENASIQARRNLLKSMAGTCGLMTNATFVSTLMNLRMTNAVLADGSLYDPNRPYKALVCLFFNGAIDSFNVLTPHGTTQGDTKFADYALTRTGAALKRRDLANGIDDGDWTGTNYGYLNPIVDSASAGGTGRTFGLHPRFSNLRTIYDNGHLTFVANCGSLFQPIANNSEFAAKIKPVGLYSHPDLQRHWQTSRPDSRNQVKGWAGKMMDLMTDPQTSASASNVYSAITTSGQSLLLTGDRISSYTIGSITFNGTTGSLGGSTPLSGIGGTPSYDRVYTSVHNGYKDMVYNDVLERTIQANRVEARDAAAELDTVWGTTSLSPVTFPTSGLGAQLAAVAKAIKIASTSTTAPLKQNRQVFMCTIGGWDHHASLLNTQNTMIPDIDNGLKAFYDFLVNESLLDKVTLFTISDFARTWSFNGSGTDHAWGGNPFVMGGAVNSTSGNRIWGQYPDILLNTTPTGLDRGRGVLIPQTSTDLYHAEICRWFGVPDNRLVDIIPNIGNFPYQGTGGHPVGFLNFN